MEAEEKGLIDIGEQIRELRRVRGLTQSELAEKSGLATNTLSLIERGLSSPTVSTLQKIASALGIDINNLFSPMSVRPGVCYIKTYQRKPTELAQGQLANLASGFPDPVFSPLWFTMEPGARSGTAVTHPGQEFVYCLQGQLLYVVETRAYLLEPGDSLLIDAMLPHRWQNAGVRPVEALLMISRREAWAAHGMTDSSESLSRQR
jgi:transcriptional regulator with XRE-family HTH domain